MTVKNLHQSDVDSYSRYVGSLSDILKVKAGLNNTTHVASVRYDDDDKSPNILSVVKAFNYSSHLWANEAVAWILANSIGVSVPTHAAVLIVDASQISADHGPELVNFAKGQTEPIILWCTAVVTPGQKIVSVMGVNWHAALLEKVNGRKLLAFDEFIGNVDRHEGNIVYLMTSGGIPVAIDNERMGYAQDWTKSSILHMDAIQDLYSPLLKTLKSGIASADLARSKKFKSYATDIKAISSGHEIVLTSSSGVITAIIENNFTHAQSAANQLLSYLGERVKSDAIEARYRS